MMRCFSRYDYFNSGVVLFDCDRIRMNDGIHSSLMNLKDVNNYDFPDQDHLNYVFKEKVQLLHPQWNSFYGRTVYLVWLARKILPPELVHDLRSPKVVHYLMAPKPWEPFDIRWLKTSMMLKRVHRYFQYRCTERRLLAPLREEIDGASAKTQTFS